MPTPHATAELKLSPRGRTLAHRAELLWELRCFFREGGFLELEPPSIVTCPGMEPHLDAFELKAHYAHHDPGRPQLDPPPRRWLHTSPEHALKRLLAEGFERVYAIGSCFRDEPSSSTHNPEFTMLEWYVKGLSLEGLMSQCERLIQRLATRAMALTKHSGSEELHATLQALDAGSFERLSVQEAFLRYAGVDLAACEEREALLQAAREAGLSERALKASASWDELYFQLFLDLVEPALGRERPTFLYDFPASQSALANIKPSDPRWALRFELFYKGLELANAFDELSDPQEQRARFEAELQTRASRGASLYPIDEPLLSALPHLGPCVGVALGFDRLVMALLGQRSITEVIAQPWLSP